MNKYHVPTKVWQFVLLVIFCCLVAWLSGCQIGDPTPTIPPVTVTLAITETPPGQTETPTPTPSGYPVQTVTPISYE